MLIWFSTLSYNTQNYKTIIKGKHEKTKLEEWDSNKNNNEMAYKVNEVETMETKKKKDECQIKSNKKQTNIKWNVAA